MQKYYREVPCTFHLVFPNGCILCNYSTIPKPGADIITNVLIQPHVTLSHVEIHITTTQTKIQNYSIPQKISLVLTPCGHTQPVPRSFPAAANHSFVLHLCNPVISRMLCKLNHTLYDLLKMLFFFLTQHFALEIHPSCEYR